MSEGNAARFIVGSKYMNKPHQCLKCRQKDLSVFHVTPSGSVYCSKCICHILVKYH